MGGLYKRTPIAVGDREGLRPTPDRVRETVFDWLASQLGSWQGRRALDLFAGTGAMGLEAASRGAQEVIAIEKDRRGAAAIRALVEKLQAPVQVLCADAFAVTGTLTGPFDVIFIDPPFALKAQLRAAQAVLPLLSEDGLLYVESDEEITDEALAGVGLEAIRRSHAGVVSFLLARRLPR